MSHLKKHLSFANVLSCLALFMALSGVAYAATLGKNSVKAKNIAKNAVTTPKLKNGAVKAAKLSNGAVIGSKIANEAVGTAKLAPASVRSSALGGGVVTTAKLKDLAVTEGKLANNAVSTDKIQNGAVSAAKLLPGLLAQLVKNVSYDTETSTLTDSSTPKEATVDCPAGKVAISGGAKVIGGTLVALTDSAPTPPNAEGKRIAWTAAAAEMGLEASNWSLEVHVVCAEL